MNNRVINLLNCLKKTTPWAFRHLIFSLILAGIVSILIFGVWFPAPFGEISGGFALFALILGVDIVCGPILTLLLLHPSKSFKARAVDLILILFIQLGALIYGLHSLSLARPLALVFEVDRFRVITLADITDSDMAQAPAWVQPWGVAPPKILSIRTATSGVDKIRNVNSSLQGVETSQRPNWWQDYSVSVPKTKERSQPLSVLEQLNPEKTYAIQLAAVNAALNPEVGETNSPNKLRWLPLVGRQTLDWVVLIDPETARIRGYVKANGFAF
jgi:hypothetical protein